MSKASLKTLRSEKMGTLRSLAEYAFVAALLTNVPEDHDEDDHVTYAFTDVELAEAMHCHPKTVSRTRERLRLRHIVRMRGRRKMVYQVYYPHDEDGPCENPECWTREVPGNETS